MLELPITLAFVHRPLDRRELTAGETAQLDRIGSEQRAVEWLRGRAALRDVLVQRGDAPDTSALAFPCPRYSLSHSHGVAVAAGVDAHGAGDIEVGARGLGVDFELEKPMRFEAARFFLTDAELAWVETLAEERRSEHLLRLWTVKEALYKADPHNHGRTLRDYRIDAPEETTGHGRTPDRALQRYTTNRTHGGTLTVAITRGER